MAKKNLNQIFAQNIQRKRKTLGMTQEDLAERLDVSQQSMSRLERGVMAPKFERLSHIAGVLQCSVAELFMEDRESRNCNDFEDRLAKALQELSKEDRDCMLRLALALAKVLKGSQQA